MIVKDMIQEEHFIGYIRWKNNKQLVDTEKNPIFLSQGYLSFLAFWYQVHLVGLGTQLGQQRRCFSDRIISYKCIIVSYNRVSFDQIN